MERSRTMPALRDRTEDWLQVHETVFRRGQAGTVRSAEGTTRATPSACTIDRWARGSVALGQAALEIKEAKDLFWGPRQDDDVAM